MKKPIKLSSGEWDCIFNQIKNTHTPSIYLIRDKMKQVLGFTTRSWYDPLNDEDIIFLDFFNEDQRLKFILKYGDLFENS